MIKVLLDGVLPIFAIVVIGYAMGRQDIFNKNSVVQYKWDLSNLLETVQKVINNYEEYIVYAIKLQDQYKSHSFGKLGQEIAANELSNSDPLSNFPT